MDFDVDVDERGSGPRRPRRGPRPTRFTLASLLPALTAALALGGCSGSGGGTAPRPQRLVLVSASRQTGRADEAAGSSPVVRVVDDAGKPVDGVEVRFSARGGGTAEPGMAISGPDGMAGTAWRLGVESEQSLDVTSPALPGPALTIEADVLPSSGYRIDLRLLTTATDAQWRAFTGAAARIGEVIVGALTPANLSTGTTCEGTDVSGRVDNLLILVRVERMDGVGGILGQAGPCVVRGSSHLPAVGVMELDGADLDRLEKNGALESVILHEMLHVVGFGTEWNAAWRTALVVDAGTASSAFVGPHALAAAKGLNGAPDSWRSVPLENCVGYPRELCGPGTQDSHWLESEFGSELMTGWLSGMSQPLSATTLGSLWDMGYTVDLDAADPLDLAPAALRGEARASEEPVEAMGDDVLHLPLTVVP